MSTNTTVNTHRPEEAVVDPAGQHLVVIVGINGRQGTSVASAFLQDESFRVRGLASSIDCAASDNWRSLGVEMRQETFEQSDHVRKNFEGAKIIFASTCAYKHLEDRRLHLAYQVGMMRGTTGPVVAMHKDIAIGHMLLDAAAATTGLETFVMSTFPVVGPNQEYSTPLAKRELEAKKEHLKYLLYCLPDLRRKTILVKPSLRMEDYRLTLRMVRTIFLIC